MEKPVMRTITVCSGQSPYAKAAQQHALKVAKLFGARLKIVGIWNGDDTKATERGESQEALMREDCRRVAGSAERAGVPVAWSVRGDGMIRALLGEARETDLLVLGLPVEAERDTNDIATRLLKDELPVLRKAQCALLAVSEPPNALRRIVVRYEDDHSGKAALRWAGGIAEPCKGDVAVLVLEEDVTKAAELAGAAEQYLKGFDLQSLKTIPKSAPTGSKTEILEAAESLDADLIVLGDEGHGVLERFFGRNIAERTALATTIPLLIAR
jgi:nucleotide-binding universal stress UspA family protein